MTLSRKRTLALNTLLSSLLVVLFFLNGYHQTLFLRPGSVHQWRQTDCLSIAKNYYEEGMHFFQPRIHNLIVENGKAVSECPILNYGAASLWKIFGEHEFIYRLLGYAIYMTALLVLFNTVLGVSGSGWLAGLAVGMLITSPLLTYYSLNFIADVPALSLAIICFCLLYRFISGGGERNYYAALFFGTLAVLMKASALVPLGLTLLVGGSLFFLNTKHYFPKAWFRYKVAAALASLLALVLIVAWYQYAIYYNNYDRNNIFLLTIMPVWEMQPDQVIHNLKTLFNDFFPLFLSMPLLFFVLFLVTYVLVNFRRLERFLKWSFAISGLYFICYLLFFFQVFGVHDYYLVNLFIFPVITLFSAINLLTEPATSIPGITTAKIFVTALALFSALHAAAIYRLRTIEGDGMANWYPFIGQNDIEAAKYESWKYGNSLRRLENITPVLRAAGIRRDDPVMSIPDESINISLYMMDQKGYPIWRYYMEHDSAAMDEFIDRVRYVILSDTGLKQARAFQRTKEKFDLFFTHGPVQVFKLKSAG